MQHKNWRDKAFDDILFVKPEHHPIIHRFRSTSPVRTHGCIIDNKDYKGEKYCKEFDRISKIVGSRIIAQHNEDELLSSYFKGEAFHILHPDIFEFCNHIINKVFS